MLRNLNLSITKNRLVSRCFQIAVALWFLRMVLPGVKYLFLPSLFVLVILSLWSLKGDLFKREYIFEFLKTFNPLLILGLFYIVGMLLSGSVYPKVLYDLFEFIINFFFLIIFFGLTYYSKEEEGFFGVFKRMSRVMWVTSVVVAIIGLSKFLMQLGGFSLPISTPWGTALTNDKNFYALYSFLGIIGLYPRLFKAKSILEISMANALQLLLVLNILFFFFLRSVLLILILAIALVLSQVFRLFLKRKELNVRIKKLRILAIVLIGFSILFVYLYKTEKVDRNELHKHYFNKELTHNEGTKSFIVENSYQFDKWSFALEYYSNQPAIKKIFGGGFKYLKDFGNKYYPEEKKIDYPHNPLISALLYSGLLGAGFVLFFMLVAFYYTIIYFRQHTLYSLMLLVCGLFVFFSGNSLFSVPIFLFLFSLAFLIRHQEMTDLNLEANLDKPGSKYLKEVFDYLASVVGLILISPLLIVIGVLVLFSSGWPVVFTQTRVGQNGKTFRLHKFRTMKNVKSDTTVAAAETQRITKIGAFLRRNKLDELPELWNIIRGDMSFVGTRPDVPGYADKLDGDDRIILKLKPGITGPASLKYISEEDILAKQEDPQKYNDEVIWPDKVKVNKQYYKNWNFFTDIKIILFTIFKKQLK